MSDLRGISEKCADALKMYEPLVVLDDVVVTVDKEKERLYIVSKEDGACKEFKLGDGGIEEKTDEEQLYVDSSNSIYRLFRTMSMFSYKNNMCGYGDKLYIFSYKSFSNQVAQMFDIKTFEKKDMMALVGCSDTNAYPQCNGQYIVYSKRNGELLCQKLNTTEMQYVHYADGTIVKSRICKLIGTQIYFCENHTEYVYDILSGETKLIYEFDKDSNLSTCLESYCQQNREAVTEFFNGYQYTVAQNEKKNTVEFAKLNLSTGEMEIEELDMRARYDEIGAWQLCNGHLYYTTLNSNAYLVDCDLTEGGYIDNILEDKCPLVKDRYSEKFNVLGDWLYYKYGYKYHRISLKDGLHIVCR